MTRYTQNLVIIAYVHFLGKGNPDTKPPPYETLVHGKAFVSKPEDKYGV